MDEDRAQNPDTPETPEVPVLQEIVEIRIGAEGQRITVPVDLDQLAARITDELAHQLQKELAEQFEACLDQALDAAMAKIRHEVQKVLLEQLGNNSDS